MNPKRLAKASKADRQQQVLQALFQELVNLKANVDWLRTREMLRTQDPLRLEPAALRKVGEALGVAHQDLLEVWAKRIVDDEARTEALMGGIEAAVAEAEKDKAEESPEAEQAPEEAPVL